MSRALLLLLALAACTLRPYDFDAGATDADATTSSTTAPASTTGPSPTTDPPTTSTTSTTDATTSSTGSTGYEFIKPTDDGTGTKECDQWIQNCPEGQKCMPVSLDGDNAWESLKCVPIVPNPDGLGDPCMVFGGGVSGEDTCDEHMMCWHLDFETGIGQCVGQCKGSPDNPTCDDPKTNCLIAAEGVLTLCIDYYCDPLLQDCPNADLCVANPMDPNGFICVSGEEGQTFDPCEYANACDPGLICADPLSAEECDPQAPGCCLPFCDLGAPPSCPGNGQECLPWFDVGQAPPGYENVGTCGLPP
jgi:hypothetical protein